MPNNLDYFVGVKHPYDVKNTLKQDSLTFSATVSKSLPLISANAKWILIMQDWEVATTVFAFKLFITLHNSYDSEVVF